MKSIPAKRPGKVDRMGRLSLPESSMQAKGVHDRFALTNDQFSISGYRIRIPNLGARTPCTGS